MAVTKAFVLVETAVGRARGIAAALRGMPGLASVDVTTGPYDVIIVLEAGSLADVAELVTAHVHNVGGVVRTVTCLVMLENTSEATRS